MSQSPQPVDYATPQPRRPWTLGKVLLLAAVLLGAVFIVAIAGWGVSSGAMVAVTVAPPVAAAPPARPPAMPVVLSTDPLTIDLRQRGGLQLPGGTGTPYLTIGDISGNQVIVSVTQSDGSTLLSKSMRPGDTASFSHAGQTLYLTLTKLINRIASDEASLQLSRQPPATTHPASGPGK